MGSATDSMFVLVFVSVSASVSVSFGHSSFFSPQSLLAQLWASTHVWDKPFVCVLLGCDVVGTHLTFICIARRALLVVCFGVLLWARISRSSVSCKPCLASCLLVCVSLWARVVRSNFVSASQALLVEPFMVVSNLVCCYGHASHV